MRSWCRGVSTFMSTPAQIAANQQNAQLSTGPTTPEGKAKSSHNAVKSALTGQTVLLPTDDVAAYTALVERLVKKHNPADDDERSLVQSIADTEWRLLRIPELEAGIRAVGSLKLADLYAHVAEFALRKQLIDAEVQLTYKKDLSNLALQETRLLRRRKNDLAELEQMQARRKEAEAPAKDIREAAHLWARACNRGNTFVPELFGFEFSVEEIEKYQDLYEFKCNMVGESTNLSKREYQAAFERFVTKKAA